MLDRRFITPLVLVFLPTLSIADEIHVPADAPTIQAAVDLSIPGSVIVVGDGIWNWTRQSRCAASALGSGCAQLERGRELHHRFPR
ncbi:MAG: hypothetical protein ACI9F9_000359 [Candidatus Paceibacteria bacterium]|jgi:hypothetical protein